MEDSGEEDRREPMINAPWPAVLIAALIILCRVAQMVVGEDAWLALAFSPADLTTGRWTGLATGLLVYPTWGGALVTAALALAFAAPLGRWFGPDRSGAAATGAIFILGGVAGGVVHALVYAGQAIPFDSGFSAVAAMAGAASRLFGREPGELGPPWGRFTLALLGAYVALVMAMDLIVATAGGSLAPGWQGNIAGYLSGVLLIGLFSGRPRTGDQTER